MVVDLSLVCGKGFLMFMHLREKQKSIVLVFDFIQNEYFILGEFGPYFGPKWDQSHFKNLYIRP